MEARGSEQGQSQGQPPMGKFAAWPAVMRWNFVVLGADMAFFSLGLSISSAYTILPLFVHHLTANPLAIALIPAVRNLGLYAPQLLVAPLVERRRHALPMILRLTILERVPYLFLGIAALVLATGHTDWLLGIFFLSIFLALLGSGLCSPPWLDMIARSVPSGWIGRFFGLWTGLGGVFGIGGAALAAAILAHVTWPLNFALCFFLTFAMFVISFVLLSRGREPQRPEQPEQVAPAPTLEAESPARGVLAEFAEVRGQLRAIWLLARGDRGLWWLIAANGVLAVASMAGAFFAVAALGSHGSGGLSVAQVGAESSVLFVGSMGGNFLWGNIGDRYGHKAILVWSSLCAAAAAVLALVATGFVAWGAVFFLYGLTLSGTQLASFTFITEFGPPERRPTYIALASVAYAPFAVGAPLVGGWLAGFWGFGLVFVLSGAAGLAATALYRVAVPDPRKRRQPGEPTSLPARP